MKTKFYATILLIIVLSSCQKEDIELPISQQLPETSLEIDTTSSMYLKIKELGFIIDSIKDIGEYYLVEGDILFPKSSATLKQARSGYLIPWDKQPNITVRVDNSIPTSGDDNWRTEIQQALSDWDNISDCRINFTYTTDATADITIQSDGGALPYYALAAAEFPIYGQPGYRIRINLDFYYNMIMSTGQKRYNMVHELGHCIGFRHTNWVALGESDAGVGLHHIPETPATDQFSVMNGGTALDSWNDFSVYDVTAAQYLFGKGRRVVLRTWDGYYVQAFDGGGDDVDAASSNPWEWETFHLMVSPLYGEPYYVLQTIDGGYYMQAINGGGGSVDATSLNPWEWETFELIESPYYSGKYVLKTKYSGQYLQAVDGGGGSLVANSPYPYAYESFEILDSWF